MSYFICGIQQIGLGNSNVYQTWEFYRKHLGMDLPIFDEAAVANLMLPYTANKPQKRHAVLALNFQGGGGLEIWQYTDRTPQGPLDKIQVGDLGIFSTKYKAENVDLVFNNFEKSNIKILSTPTSEPFGIRHFFAEDPFGNVFEITESDSWYTHGLSQTGGVLGCTIGVTNMEKSIAFYKDVLGYDLILNDQKGQFTDFNSLSNVQTSYHRVLLTHKSERQGPFSKLLGKSQIELVSSIDISSKKIFENRLWGDLGYIHLCFDIVNMQDLKSKSEKLGYKFTVDSSNSFDMGEAAGHFCYTEDPDGTLIEFVETHKIPILKKLNWYLDLRNRSRTKPLPNWMLKALSFNRVTKPVI